MHNCSSALFLSYLVHFGPPTILYSYCEGVIFFVSEYFLEMCEHLSPILYNLQWCGKVNRNTNIALKGYTQFKKHNQQKQWASDSITKQSCNNFVMRKRQQEIPARGSEKKIESPYAFRSCSRAIHVVSIREESSYRRRSLTPLQFRSLSADYAHGLVAIQSKIPSWIPRTLMKLSLRISGVRARSNRGLNPERSGWKSDTLRLYHLYNVINQ